MSRNQKRYRNQEEEKERKKRTVNCASWIDKLGFHKLASYVHCKVCTGLE